MTIQDDLTAIREALDAGPTPGPWSRSLDLLGIRGDAAQPVCRAAHILDAAYIAACSPDRIARLVEHVERLEAALRNSGLLNGADAMGWDTTAIRAALEGKE
jgi:hypothetical protein